MIRSGVLRPPRPDPVSSAGAAASPYRGTMARRVTAADVASALGVSRATVGFVLNDTPGQTISAATRERVRVEADRMGYRPHSAARALASGRSHIVLMLLPDWPVEHSMRAHLDEASLVLDRAGYSFVTTTPHPGGQAVPLWESLAPDVVLALAPVADAQYAAIRATGAATLIPGRDAPGLGRDLRFEEGPRLQVEHLLGIGRRRIAFAGAADPRLANLSRQRLGLAERTHRDLTGASLAARADVGPSDAAGVVDAWIGKRIDGIVAYNDEIAALVLAAAVRRGVRVPVELAIVGHDDSPLAALLVPSLSTVRVDTVGLGRFVAELALSAAGDGPAPSGRPEFNVELVRREST